MPNLGKGTEIVKLLLTQASKDMYEPLVPMFFPIFGAHMSGAEFQYPDLSWKEPTGLMANLVAHSGDNKGQLTTLAKAICRDFRQHDEAEEKKLLSGRSRRTPKEPTRTNPIARMWRSVSRHRIRLTPPSSRTQWRWRQRVDSRSTSTCLRWKWPTVFVEVTSRYQYCSATFTTVTGPSFARYGRWCDGQPYYPCLLYDFLKSGIYP